ncbi:hypothetical protein GCM10011578_022350 [Streptomyces fuscichromogenes]|uniref:SnoaL-like domain-containing protein n=1 Tax=Streptomyces fuscichromogenes TaxID=1324013 RepID=A0A918CQL9_9ACTN|nr:hypothetical protein GCM10011578_022350 [Streptomyces fuscichromogenes]
MESVDQRPQDDGHERERDNCIQFFLVDFLGWNNRKWDMHEHYHASDVYVEMMGVATTGVEKHIADMQNVIEEYPDMLIRQHTPPVAEGEWTASVVHQVGFGPDATSTAAVHRHRGGKMVEEYWFGRALTEGEPDRYAGEEPFLTITSPDSHLLQVSVDVRPGWSVVVRGSEVGRRSATFTRREDGEVVEQLRFLAA